MDSLSLLGYLLIFLVVAILVAISYSRLKEWKIAREKALNQHLADVEARYKNLVKEIKEFRSNESLLKADYLEIKKTIARESSAHDNGNTNKAKKVQATPLEILIKQGAVSEDKLEKARRYKERSDNAALTVEDSLVLLGFITSEQLTEAQKEAGGGK